MAKAPEKEILIGNLSIGKRKFVVMREELFNEIKILLRSLIQGEYLLKKKKTRTFREFLT